MLVEVNHVTKRYGDKLAVNDLTFQIDQGEVVGFLGPNGAGKSTTMNMITGYLSATEGTISVAGYDILDQPKEAKKHIGYLPELPPLYVDMTVHEYLDFLYELKKCRMPRRQHLQEICEAVRITDVYERVIRNLSKGYRQRVGLAGALIGSPELLILDEPTSVWTHSRSLRSVRLSRISDRNVRSSCHPISFLRSRQCATVFLSSITEN